MAEYTWETERTKAIEAFNGEQPGPQLEQDIIDEFILDPDRVIATLQRIAKEHNTKNFGSPWAITRANLRQHATQNPTATSTISRDKRIHAAKQWIRNAGCLYDLQRHIEAELFGDDYSKGMLADYKDDTELRTRLLALWAEQRETVGIPSEQASEAWQAKCAADHAARIARAETKRNKNPDADLQFT